MNHTELCHIAAKWVRRKHRCSVVLVDVKTINTNEQPDVIGWNNGGWSVLVEAKVSVMDFQRDHRKWFRRETAKGMGLERWYAFPKGLWEQIPIGDRKLLPSVDGGLFGVVEFDDKGKAKIINKALSYKEFARVEEKRLLITCVRRVTEGWGRGIIAETPPELLVNGDRHPMNRIRTLEHELRQVMRERDGLRAALDRLQSENARRLATVPLDQQGF